MNLLGTKYICAALDSSVSGLGFLCEGTETLLPGDLPLQGIDHQPVCGPSTLLCQPRDSRPEFIGKF
jgi:hypothetical protein